MSAEERTYLVARLVLIGILVVLFALGVVQPGNTVQTDIYLAAMALVAVDTAVLWYVVKRGRSTVASAMMYVLTPDLLAVAAFTYLGGTGDVFFVVALMLPIVYALLVERRNAWIAGWATAAGYLVGRLAAGPESPLQFVLLAGKTAAFPLVAVLVAGSVNKRRVDEREAQAQAREATRLATALQRRVDELQAVSEITDVVHSSLEFETVGAKVLDILAKAIHIDECCLFIIDKPSSQTLFSASRGSAGGMSSSVIAGGPSEADDAHLTCIPVFDHGSTMVLFCAFGEAISGLSDEERLVLGAVASELAVASENSRLFKLSQHLAVTDELTGLANYRQLQQRLDAETARADRYGKHLSLLMVDADDFKRFNDTQGHIAGDHALADLGKLLSSAVRQVDLPARYGGEEFAVVLPETDAAGAYVAAENVREAVESHLFADEQGKHECQLTVSIGLATYPTHATDKESLLREADDALYRAKSGGKNRVRTPLRPERPEDAGGESGKRKDGHDVATSTTEDEWTGA